MTKSKLRWACLEGDHFADKRSRINPCRKPSCTTKHTLLRPPDSPPRLPEPKHADSNRSVKVVSSNGFVEVFEANQRNLLPIVSVKVTVPDSDKFVITHAFLDTGSTKSFITNRLMNELNITSSTVIDLTTATLSEVNETRVIPNVIITDLCESNITNLQPLLSIDTIPVDKNDIPRQEDIKQFEEFYDLHILFVDAEVDLLIGNDNRHILQPHEIVNSVSGHYAYRTSVGWVVNCPRIESTENSRKSFLINVGSTSHPLCSLCSDVVDSVRDTNSYSAEQKRFLDFVSDSIRHCEDSHYEIPLPLRDSKTFLPSNKPMAKRRAELLKKRFDKNPQFYEDYRNFVNKMISNGYAEAVEESDDSEEGKV